MKKSIDDIVPLNDEIVVHSYLDPEVTIAIIYPGSSTYPAMSDIFKDTGIAFCMHDKKIIVIDGAQASQEWFTPEHLRVIEAHEVGHIIAEHNHKKEECKDIEREADQIGYKLLCESPFKEAVMLYREEYNARYGCMPEDDDII